MPISVSVTRQGTGLFERMRKVDVSKMLHTLCEESARKLEAMIKEDLELRWSQLRVSKGVVDRFSVFADLSDLLEKYKKCFRVEVTGDGAQLILDSDLLQFYGFPKELPELLEYGSELGIPPIPHLRTAWDNFVNVVVERLASEGIARAKKE